jgi:outer membrane receptor for ferrienterochelin and colicins
MTLRRPSSGGIRYVGVHYRRIRALLCGLFVVIAAPAAAQSSLPDLSLEDLMKLDSGQVFGASERLQPALEAPSSVSFVTAAEIEKYGFRTLADILRSVRGMYVTDDRNFSLVGIRGFAKPGDYNSRILLLVNGHRVNDNVFGQAEIGAEFGLDPATFERVEIIRGPASSLYGDSAFFAVVNVITRTGASMGGGTATVEAGTLGTELVRGSAGQRYANGLDFALSATYESSDGASHLYFPAYDSAATNNGIAENLDGEGVKQIYGRLSFGPVTVTGAYGTRRREVPTASFDTVFNSHDPMEETTDRHTLLDADYSRVFSGTRVNLRASYDRFTYDGVYPSAAEDGSLAAVGENSVVGARWSAEGGVSRVLPWRQNLRAGFQFIDNIQQDQSLIYRGDTAPVLDLQRSSTQRALYAQDEIKLTSWMIANAGLRYDSYGSFSRVSPRAAVILLPSSAQSIKYLYGSAFRAPNQYELNTYYFGDNVEGLRPEAIDTHELVWERYIKDWLRTSVSGYWYKADRLITQVPDGSTLLHATFVNQGQVRAKGLELEAQMRLPGSDSRALISYALQNAVDQVTGEDLPNSPRHIVQGRVSVSGPLPRSTVSVDGWYLSGRQTIGRMPLDASTSVNVTVLQPIGRVWQLFGTVSNVFDDEYLDPVAHKQQAIAQNGRTARIGLRWQLWSR